MNSEFGKKGKPNYLNYIKQILARLDKQLNIQKRMNCI